MFARNRWMVLMLVGLLSALGAWAAEESSLAGTFDYAPEQSDDVAKAIDRAVEKMNFIKRPIARGRLAKTNTPYQRIHIEMSATEVEITYDDRKPIRMPIDGRPIKWTRDDGETFDVSAALQGGKLVQTYKAEDGSRVNSFNKDSSGALHMAVEVSSPQLPQPVRYALLYRPAS